MGFRILSKHMQKAGFENPIVDPPGLIPGMATVICELSLFLMLFCHATRVFRGVLRFSSLTKNKLHAEMSAK